MEEKREGKKKRKEEKNQASKHASEQASKKMKQGEGEEIKRKKKAVKDPTKEKEDGNQILKEILVFWSDEMRDWETHLVRVWGKQKLRVTSGEWL